MAYVPAQLPGSTLPAPALPPSRWLASSADRERAVDVLRAGFAEGRLTQDEFDERVARAYASRTYGELGILVADLPAGVAFPLAQPLSPPPSPAVRANPPIAGLILTAIVVFTLAALFTGMALIAHHTQQVPYISPVQHTHLLPAIKPIH
ncbi:MAG TPA: DUF1707 domain-containing protein [Streptosporangiaceae bacterium]|nr:DUF1707 domain-containing protein [Streptosporangiaceae bacterium]